MYLNRKPISLNIAYGITDKALSLISNIILLPFIITKIGTQLYGVWVIFFVVSNYLSLAQLGISSSFKRFIAEDIALNNFNQMRDFLCTAFYFLLFILLIVVLVILLINKWIVSFLLPNISLSSSGIPELLFLFVFGAALSIINEVFISVPQAYQRFDITSIISMSTKTINITLIIFFLQKGYSLKGLVCASFLSNLINLLANFIVFLTTSPRNTLSPLNFKYSQLKKMLNFGIKTQISYIATWVALNFDKILIAKVFGAAYVAIYDIGTRIVWMFREFPYVIFLVLTPYSSDLNARGKFRDLVKINILATKYLSFLCSIVAAILFIFAAQILHFWIGQEINSLSIYSLRVLLVGSMIQLISGVSSSVLKGIGRPGIEAYANAILTILNICFSLLFMMSFGIKGVIWGTTLGLIIGGIILIFFTCRILKNSFVEMISSVFIYPIIFCMITIIPGNILLHILDFHIENRIYLFLFLFAGTLLISLVGIAFYSISGYIQIKELLNFIMRHRQVQVKQS